MINNLVLQRLKEREKELNTLYRLDELLSAPGLDNERLFRGLLSLMPAGWQYSSACEIRVTFENAEWSTDDFRPTEWMQRAEIVIDNSICGEITVSYIILIREFNGSQFLPEEQKLLNTIADRIGSYIFQQRLRNSLKALEGNNHNPETSPGGHLLSESNTDRHWKWRSRMAGRISQLMDMEKFGVEALYLIGSTKNATAGPASDIDLLIHHHADVAQLRCLSSWLDGWSLCLAEENFQQTGYQTERLIDVHLITDADIAARTSYAVMIGSPENSARLLRKHLK